MFSEKDNAHGISGVPPKKTSTLDTFWSQNSLGRNAQIAWVLLHSTLRFFSCEFTPQKMVWQREAQFYLSPKGLLRRCLGVQTPTGIFQRVLFDSKGLCIGAPYHPFSTLRKIQVLNWYLDVQAIWFRWVESVIFTKHCVVWRSFFFLAHSPPLATRVWGTTNVSKCVSWFKNQNLVKPYGMS